MWHGRLRVRVSVLEEVRRKADALGLQAFHGRRAHATGLEISHGVPVRVDARLVEDEQVAQADGASLHAGELGDAGDASPAAGHARQVHQQVQRTGGLLADRGDGEVQTGHADHVLQAAQRVAGAVGVHGRHRPLVAGVHGLEHVEGLAAADLADDDSVRPHAQCVSQEVPLRDLALALDVWRAGLQPHDVLTEKLELGGILDGDHALARRESTARGH